MKTRTSPAFTLAELIVVITILSILATIAFISYEGYTKSARDSVRLSNLSSLSSGLWVYQAKSGIYPSPDNPVTIYASGLTLGFQGFAQDQVGSSIGLSKGGTKDPLDPTLYPTYFVSKNQSQMQLMGFLEDGSTSTAFSPSLIPTTFASTSNTSYSTRTPSLRWDALGILLLATSGATMNQPLQESGTGVDIVNTPTLYTAYFSKTDTLTGTGGTLGTPFQINLNNGWPWFNAPTNCPTGFIPVPGNKEFSQPWFCVAKYEMSYSDGDVPDSGTSAGTKDGSDTLQDWNTVNYNSAKTVVSAPNKYPIANINQTHAIESCQKLWTGYHLITNNEWMTVARNIEQVGDNWSTGIVWNGWLYRGITSGASYINGEDGILGCRTIDSSGKSGIPGRDYIAKTLSTDTTKFWTNKGSDCDTKRQLKLSNNQIIWDLAGNVWEHVNKGNTLDTTNMDTNAFSTENFCSAGAWNWYSWYGNDGATFCNFVDSLAQSKYGPKGNYNAINGVGRIYANNAEDRNNIFFRGGDAGDGAYAGVFALRLNWDATLAYRTVGFRCSR